MKRLTAFLICAILLGALLCGCGGNDSAVETQAATDPTVATDAPSEAPEVRLSVVTTVFPVYDWVRNITDGADVSTVLLLDSGVDLHSYSPSDDDISKIADSDVFVYIGGPSEAWADSVLEDNSRADMTVIDLMQTLAISASDGGSADPDEHIWTSLRLAVSACRAITDTLCTKDAQNAGLYKANAEAYTAELNELDSEYESAANNARIKTPVFADRFPFRYLIDDYGLGYYAAFAGCADDCEINAETAAFLSDMVDRLGLKCILKTESPDSAIAEAVKAGTASKDQRILSLNSFHYVKAQDVRGGMTYIDEMRRNLSILIKAMNN